MSSLTSLPHDRPTTWFQSLRLGSQSTWLSYLLLAILALAFGLRVWGIDFGVGYDLTTDESKEIHRALKLGAGEYSWSFGKGGLYYLLFVEYTLLYVVWWITGVVSTTHEFALRVIRDQTTVFLLARLTVALMGTLTCLIIFWTGKQMHNWRVGLGAAFIGATAYSHGMSSHYIMVDIGMVLALWASLLAYLQYEKKLELRWLLGAGSLGGIAVAFKLTGAIVFPILLVAVASRPGSRHVPRQRVKETAYLLVAMLGTLTVVAPEWTMMIADVYRSLFHHPAAAITSSTTATDDIQNTIDAVTIYRGKTWTGPLMTLLEKRNVALTITTLLSAILGLWGRRRWDIILSLFILVFLVIMSVSNRGIPEHYLLPIMPAMWLLSSRAIIAGFGHRWWLVAPGFVCVVAFSFLALAYQDYMWTKADTRITAKDWIETNIASGAKILMDGMQYRFVMSPPLKPNQAVISRHVTRAAREGASLSRGVSSRALSLYAEAMAQVEEPTYDLYSTVWGLKTEELSYYIQSCFDYIITSSTLSERYISEADRKRFPNSARFYDQLKTDSRFRVVYISEPAQWQRSGPTIHVYKVLPSC